MSVETIVAELHRLRETQSEREVMGATAATSSLVVYGSESAAWRGISKAAQRIAIAHGARLLLVANGAAGEARVCTFCGGENEATICCEEITLPVDPRTPASTLADVEELILPGLPCYLWWNGGQLDGRLFAGLRGLAKRVVVDTSFVDADAHGLVELDRVLSRERHAQLWDLGWMRTAPWREMAARLFDAPERISELGRLERIEIESGARTEAALLVGWLGTQLGYAVAKEPGQFTTPSGGGVRFTYVHNGAAGEVRALRLCTPGATYAASIDREGTSVCLSVDSATEQRRRCEPLAAHTLEQLVSEALYGLGGGSAFAAALALAARIVAP